MAETGVFTGYGVRLPRSGAVTVLVNSPRSLRNRDRRRVRARVRGRGIAARTRRTGVRVVASSNVRTDSAYMTPSRYLLACLARRQKGRGVIVATQ